MQLYQPTSAAALLFLLVSLVGDRAGAQYTTTQIAVAGGVATDQRGVRSNALILAPSVSFEPSSKLSIHLGANATRFATQSFSIGAGGSFSAQDRLGRFAALTLSGSANGSRLAGPSRATFAQADLTPALELRLWRFTLFGGLRAATGVVTEEVTQTPVPLGGTRTSTASTSRAGVGPVLGGTLVLGNAHKALRLGVREEHLRIGDVTRPERSLNASLTIAVTPVASFEVAAGQYDDNRLLGTPAGEYVSAGISFRFGRLTEPALPVASGARPKQPGTTRLSIRAPDARRVEIAGDFNEWTPAAATRAANGVWYTDLKIPPGQYRYAFRIDGTEWRVPRGATAVDDGFGGKSAWLTVSDAGSR